MGYKYSNAIEKVKVTSPITLVQAKDHCSVDVDYTDDDRLFLSKINQATSFIEDKCGIDIVLTENRQEFIEFDGNILCMEEVPLKELKSIKKTIDGVEEEVESEDYDLQTKKTSFIIRFKDTVVADKLTIEFDTGYSSSDIPHALESAILIKVNDLYDMERTSYTIGTNFRKITPIESLISAYTINRW